MVSNNHKASSAKAWILQSLTPMLLLANFANTKWCKKPEKWLKPWQMGAHLRVLSESYPMNTNMTRLRRFSKIFAYFTIKPCLPGHEDVTPSSSQSSWTRMLLVANFANTKWCKNVRSDLNPVKWVLIWEYTQQELSNEYQYDRV